MGGVCLLVFYSAFKKFFCFEIIDSQEVGGKKVERPQR